MAKVLIIGLDGATWDIIEPLVEEGKLSTFKKLMTNGVWGKLEATIPPVTGPSWVSFSTGMNPGKTGVFDFLVREERCVDLTPMSSEMLKGRAFWDCLSSQGYKVGILDFPMLYPPYEINGFMISGTGAPRIQNITFPKELRNEIDKATDGYKIVVDYHKERYDSEELFVKDLGIALDKKVRALYYLSKNKNWDLLLTVFSCTDWLQHLMWKHIDVSSPLYDAAKSKVFRPRFVEIWQRIDEAIKHMVELFEDTNVLIVSDHGFGPQRGCFYINTWLEKEGFLAKKRKVGVGTRTRTRNIIKKALQPLLSFHSLKKALKHFDFRVTVEEQIDFEKSTAFALGHTIPLGAIYINVKGREPWGIVEKGRQYDALKEEICKKLVALGGQLDAKLEVTIFDPRKVYQGDKLDLAPDIIFTINNWECVVIKSFSDQVYKDAPYSNRHTGSHRMNGIFLAYGPDMKKGMTIKDAKIYDVAPTVLHLLNSPISNDMDGRVLTEIFPPGSEVAGRKITYVKPLDSEKQRISNKIRELKKAKRI
jgi:predicted AlkP superfamily phosphohydrolase/phosphomutase